MQFSPQKLRQARESAKLTLEEVAHRLKNLGYSVSLQSIWNYEKGESIPNSETMMGISKVLRKNVNFFFIEKLN